ncbi:MAG: hypothetical protein M1819_007061 [Sarea resinae]|nr:MAG: hypothetical protein M1819_007061 [Sarea resinae]
MAVLPTFHSLRRSRRSPKNSNATTQPPSTSSPSASDETARSFKPYDFQQEDNTSERFQRLHRATRTRQIFCLLTSLFFLISLIFTILVEIGSTHRHGPLERIYFLKLDLSQIIPRSVPNSVLINSIARTLGLHDFYQVGVWNFCEGYDDQGVTRCARPETLYWFNPVDIILNELLAGATIALPATITDALHLAKTASHWMFGLFLTGAILSYLMIFLVPLSIYTRWASLPISIITFLAALCVTAATIIATAMFIIFRNVFTGATEVNIGAKLGSEMFAFMWIASAFSILGWLFQLGMCCCCASRRDVRTGRKKGSSKAYGVGFHKAAEAGTVEAPQRASQGTDATDATTAAEDVEKADEGPGRLSSRRRFGLGRKAE